MLYKIHHGIKFFRSFQEYFNGLFNVMFTIFDCFGDFFFRKLAVNVKGDGSFLDVVSHKTFKRFQTTVCTKHYIIIPKGELSEKAAELPTGISFDDNIITNLFRIEPAKDSFKNILVEMSGVETAPYSFNVCFV